MKRIIYFLLISFLGFGSVAIAEFPIGYKVKYGALNISLISPPALIYVEDSQGRKSGANPSISLNADGTQGSDDSTDLTDIPLSYVSQQNVGSDDPATQGLGKSETTWNIIIDDGGSQTYTVNLLGVKTGVAEVELETVFKHAISQDMDEILDAFVTVGQLRKININFDPIQRTMTSERVVSEGDLVTDVLTACQLNLISPNGICQDLEAKANSIVKDAKNNNTQMEIQHLQVFLKALQAIDKNHIQEPAFTILQEEAQKLLNDLNGQ